MTDDFWRGLMLMLSVSMLMLGVSIALWAFVGVAGCLLVTGL